MKQPLAHNAKARERRFSGSEAVTQDCILSVFAEIVASREYFSDPTGARRLRRFNVQNLQAAFPFHRLWNFVRRSGVNAALRWLRVRRAALYRGFLICQSVEIGARPGSAHALPNAIRRYSRLKICAPLLEAPCF
jgi:hypothetical protein